MPTIRQIADGKVLWAYGTPEGVTRAWDTRGRGRRNPDDKEECISGDCTHEIHLPEQHVGENPPIVIPHLDNLELMMTSDKGGQNIHFDKEAMKAMLRMALVQLDAEDSNIKYINTPGKQTTDHYATIKFRRNQEHVVGAEAE